MHTQGQGASVGKWHCYIDYTCQKMCLRMVIGKIEKASTCRYGTCEPNSATSLESFLNCLSYEVERGSRNKCINQRVLVLSCWFALYCKLAEVEQIWWDDEHHQADCFSHLMMLKSTLFNVFHVFFNRVHISLWRDHDPVTGKPLNYIYTHYSKCLWIN